MPKNISTVQMRRRIVPESIVKSVVIKHMGISKKIALYIIIKFSGLRNILLFINGNLTRAEGIHTHTTYCQILCIGAIDLKSQCNKNN